MNLVHIWPKKLSLTEYRRVAFAGKPPGMTTLKRWINDGQLPGEKMGTRYFVTVNQALEVVALPNAKLLTQVDTGNAQADALLAEILTELV